MPRRLHSGASGEPGSTTEDSMRKAVAPVCGRLPPNCALPHSILLAGARSSRAVWQAPFYLPLRAATSCSRTARRDRNSSFTAAESACAAAIVALIALDDCETSSRSVV